ncbi:MAG: rhomboid family intramembrane serine protease [Alphaproteobacteria bacterium]|nr:rhomboid family intramembrane serine protease [Alphaproteobacteria bacterium]
MFLPLHDRNPIVNIRAPYVNYGLIAVTVLVFLYQQSLAPQAFDHVVLGFGMIPIVVRDLFPEPIAFVPDEVTLVTYAFLHADWMHLLSNMLFLWIFGDNIEDALGHWAYALFYLGCAALAALAYLMFNFDSNAPLIGASGAVAGVMGAYAVLFPWARVFVLARVVLFLPIPVPAIVMLGLWLAIQLFYALAGSDEMIAWWAHIGGMAVGVAVGLLVRRMLPHRVARS